SRNRPYCLRRLRAENAYHARTVAGREYLPTAGHGHTGSCPVLIACCLSLSAGSLCQIIAKDMSEDRSHRSSRSRERGSQTMGKYLMNGYSVFEKTHSLSENGGQVKDFPLPFT
ncbi:MAG: hypothetical protein IKL38_04045, partial [Firmicutes bacterium]|nr:hypothetical protein [Bacillota bacterium]